jgi:acetyl-CoA acetyltransferase
MRVYLLGVGMTPFGRWIDVSLPELARRAARTALDDAGLDASDVRVAVVVGPGEDGVAAERGRTSIGGDTPVNPSGGLESRGHPIGATGLAQVFELATQLRGEAGSRQVRGARIAVAENGGGLIGLEEAAVSMVVLEAAS